MIPTYANMAEIQAYGTKDEGDVILIRFLYREPKIENAQAIKRPHPLVFPGPAILMPRNVAKDFLKKFLGFIAIQEEHKKEV